MLCQTCLDLALKPRKGKDLESQLKAPVLPIIGAIRGPVWKANPGKEGTKIPNPEALPLSVLSHLRYSVVLHCTEFSHCVVQYSIVWHSTA